MQCNQFIEHTDPHRNRKNIYRKAFNRTWLYQILNFLHSILVNLPPARQRIWNDVRAQHSQPKMLIKVNYSGHGWLKKTMPPLPSSESRSKKKVTGWGKAVWPVLPLTAQPRMQPASPVTFDLMLRGGGGLTASVTWGPVNYFGCWTTRAVRVLAQTMWKWLISAKRNQSSRSFFFVFPSHL